MKRSRFITGYSGLRALAVIGVILYHFDPNVYVGGYLGVPIFFVLTGYLVTDQVVKSLDATGTYPLGSFYRKRIKRLYPQIITVLWASSAYILLFQRNLLAKLWQVVVTNLLNVYNFWQIANGQSYFERFASNESPFTHLWTMSIDGQFYLFWPLIIILLFALFKGKKKPLFWTIMALTAVSAIEMALLYATGADINRIYYGTDTRFFSLGMGASLAIIWPMEKLRSDIELRDSLILDITGLVAFLGMIWLFFDGSMNPQTAFPYQGGMLLFSLFTAILVGIIAHPGSDWNRLLTNPIFDWIGSRSYAIYLYQFPVMIFFEDKVTNLADHVLLYRLIELAIILFLAEFTYRQIELRFKHFSWEKVKAFWTESLNFHNKNYVKNATGVSLALVMILGVAAVGISPMVKAEDYSKSALAKRIAQNSKTQTEGNQKAIKKIRKSEQKKRAQSSSTTTKKAKRTSKKAKFKHKVNQSFEKYGISQAELQKAQKVQVLAIGDSVMASSSDDLQKLMPNSIVDAAVSRQANTAEGLLDSYQNKGALADNLLIGLGTNGPFDMDEIDHIMHQATPKREVFWINVYVPSRSWQGQVNDLLQQAQKKYHNFRVIDWYGLAQAHPTWLYDDHTHPNVEGAKYYSAYIVKQIVKYAKF